MLSFSINGKEKEMLRSKLYSQINSNKAYISIEVSDDFLKDAIIGYVKLKLGFDLKDKFDLNYDEENGLVYIDFDKNFISAEELETLNKEIYDTDDEFGFADTITEAIFGKDVEMYYSSQREQFELYIPPELYKQYFK